MKLFFLSLTGLCLAATVSACSPEVGSAAWCSTIKEKPAGDWTATEAKEYAKNCLFKMGR